MSNGEEKVALTCTNGVDLFIVFVLFREKVAKFGQMEVIYLSDGEKSSQICTNAKSSLMFTNGGDLLV